jgi:hypothetical protein
MVTATYVRPYLYEKQEKAIFTDARYTIIEASTKSGKTVGCLIWLFEQAIQGFENYNYWWIAPIFAQTKIAFRRMKTMLNNVIPVKVSDSELRIVLPNKAVITFKSGDNPDSLYGDDVYAAVIDEGSRAKYEAFVAVRSTVTATRGKLVIIGNVHGRKNWMFRLARKAESGNFRNYAYAKITAYDAVAAGVLERDEIEDARSLLPQDVFDELYLAEATEDGSNPFGIKNIEECIRELSENKPMAYGIDLARKVDFTVITGIDELGNICHYERFQKSWPETTSKIIHLPYAPTLLDSTGVGDTILQNVQRERRRTEGFLFTQRSKQQLMENLQLKIAQHAIGFPEEYKDELENMEYVYSRTGISYSAPEGLHDDKVMSLGLVVLHRDKQMNKNILIGRAG